MTNTKNTRRTARKPTIHPMHLLNGPGEAAQAPFPEVRRIEPTTTGWRVVGWGEPIACATYATAQRRFCEMLSSYHK